MSKYNLLKELCEVPGIPGREGLVRDYIIEQIEDYCDHYFVDDMGNLHAVVEFGSSDADRVMLACHMDEIGFMVNYISPDGFIYCQPLGGFDPRNLFSRRVRVVTRNGNQYLGVMNPAGLPVHLASPEERKRIPNADEFVIDIGKDANGLVCIGDFIVMEEPFIEMGTKVVSKALDNRVACYLGIKTLKELYDNGGNYVNVHVVFTVQEEVGLRGAKTAAMIVKPDYAIGVDVTLSCDTPGVPANKHVTTQGKGFALGIRDASFIGSEYLADIVRDVAEEFELDYQEVVSSGGGMDGAAMQQAGGGCHSIAISVGTRYIHTVTEMLDTRDLDAAEVAIVETIRAL